MSSIRNYQSKDHQGVKSLYMSTVKDFPQIPEKYFLEALEKDLKDVSSFYQQRTTSPRDNFFVAEDESGEIVGMVGLQYHSDKEAELRRMVVSEKMRGKQMGVKIVNHLLEFCKSQGYSRVHLTTSEYVTAARGLYQKCGFKESKRFNVEGYEYVVIEYEYLF